MLRRPTAHSLADRGSRMPGAEVGLPLGPDNVHFRRRLRAAHPETEQAIHTTQRQACVRVWLLCREVASSAL